MLIFPAIDLYDGKAVRLYKGDYAQMTVYSENPPEIAEAPSNASAKPRRSLSRSAAACAVWKWWSAT